MPRKTNSTHGLILTRRENEETVIGDPKNPIGVVRIASIRGNRVRIAFDFPEEIPVNRREVADKIQAEPAPLANLRKAPA
jgi:carbon storage regulator CsrA